MTQKFPLLELLNNVSEIDIVYKKKVTCKVSERPQINSSDDTYQLLMHYWNQDKIELIEEFKVLFLNRSNRVMQIMHVSSGGMTGTVADPRVIISVALRIGACSMVLAHNHPSGSLKPSKQDEDITYKLNQAVKYFDIKILDHLIVSTDGYYSFTDEGMLY